MRWWCAAPGDLPRAHYYRIVHFALFHRAVGCGDLDVNFDHIANARIALVATEHANVPSDFGPGIVGHIKMRTNLQHKIISGGDAIHTAALFHHRHQAPALEFAHGTSFHNFHNITDAAIIVLIVSHETLGLLHEFTVNRVA